MIDEELNPSAVMRDIQSWLANAVTNGPYETRGHSDQSGHPHTYAVILVPNWQVKQKLATIQESLAQGSPDGEPPQADPTIS